MGQTAINYGKVLLQLSVPREDIECSKQIWESSDRLRQALCSPIIKQEEKYRVLQQIFPKSMHPFLLIRNFSVRILKAVLHMWLCCKSRAF